MAFEVNNSVIRSAIDRLGYETAPGGAQYLLGVRAALPWTGGTPDEYYLSLQTNTLDLYNDTLIIWGDSWWMGKGTCDPGAYYTETPISGTGGVAHLANGCWLFEQGTHDGNWCLTQAEPVTVYRDRNKSGDIDTSEEAQSESGWFGIQIHCASGSHISNWSAGCNCVWSQSCWSGPEWAKFRDIVKASGQSAWKYYLMDGADLVPPGG